MSEKSQKYKLKARDSADAMGEVERPTFKWKVVLQIAAAFLILWVTAFGTVQFISYWGVGVMAVLTLVAVGFGIYVWRLTKKSQAIADILSTATDPEGRKKAIEKLEAESGSDALKALAHAQLVAQEKPAEAVRILEGIDLKKAPAVAQDDVRANLALMYLMQNRARDARTLADEIRLDRQPNPKSKALYAAVVAESFSRTGKADEASKLLETYRHDDPAYGEVSAMLLRAQVYTFSAIKKRGLAKKAMESLAQTDLNMLAGFVQKGTHPEIMQMARQILGAAGMAPKMKMRAKMR
ncbi:MAG: hypothetical protein IPJ88_10295 [Myxococcales bacterium]|nr:MAG: hypothetical protein IPJ88_10295 [Myxococcales bacterium]